MSTKNLQDNGAVADKLKAMSYMMALIDENRFKVVAFQNAADSIRRCSDDLSGIKLESIPGIGSSIAAVIREILASGDGECKRLESLCKLTGFPYQALTLLKVQSIGIKTAGKMAQAGIRSIEDLKKAIQRGTWPDPKGKLKLAVETALNRAPLERIPISFILPTINQLLEHLRVQKGIVKAEVAGSVRRRKDTVKDADIIIAVKNDNVRKHAIKTFLHYSEGEQVVNAGMKRARILIPIVIDDEVFQFQVDLLVCKPEEFGASLLHYTGPRGFNIILRNKAIKRGMKLNEYGLWDSRGRLIEASTETAIYKKLKLPYIPPELRDDTRIVKTGHVPELLTGLDARKDIHIHTTWSDGMASPERVILKAIDRDLVTVGISDHAYTLHPKHGKSLVKAYVRELKGLQKKYARKIRVVIGVEVDIRNDGSLSLSNDELKLFDYVIASIHKNHSDNVEQRIIAAAVNDFVSVIGHPTGREYMHRDRPKANWHHIFKACARNRTALEINASPGRLDLSDDLIRVAKAVGCKFSIASDAHHPDYVGRINLGVEMARRAGLTKQDLLGS